MFGGRFSLTRFSLKVVEDFDAKIEVEFLEEIRSAIFSIQNTAVEHNYRNQITAESLLTRGVRLGFTLNEKINSSANTQAVTALVHNFTENVTAQINTANNVNAVTSFNENVRSKVYLAYDYNFGLDFIETVSALTQFGVGVPILNNFREAIFMVTTANELDSDSMIIDVRIPIGGTLIIDAENFIVMLNGENVIHLHSGDFINIPRNVVDMIIACDGRLNGELMYTERFL